MAMTEFRCSVATGLGSTRSAPLGSRANEAIPASISVASRTLRGISCTLNEGAAASIVRKYAAQDGFAGSKTTATRLTLGEHSFITCSHLPPIENSKLVKPVTFPSGCARFVTYPAETASGTCTNTIGIDKVCCRTAVTAGVVAATITSGRSSTSSFASFGVRVASPPPKR